MFYIYMSTIIDDNEPPPTYETSIIQDRLVTPFWNDKSESVSKKLWVPYAIVNHKTRDIHTLEHTGMTHSISVDVPSQPILKDVIVAKKLRIYPDAQQISFFQKCFNAHRYMYNKSLADFRTHNERSSISIRKRVLIPDKSMPKDHPERWLKKVPYYIRDEAIRSLAKNVKTCMSHIKSKLITHFKLSFMSKKYSDDIFHVAKAAISKDFRICPQSLDKEISMSAKSKKWLTQLGRVQHDCKITRNKAGHYYIIVPYKRPTEVHEVNKTRIVALDPGVRTFQTFYSQTECGKIGDAAINDIKKINAVIDKKISSMTTVRSKTKYNLKKRCNKLRTKVSNIVSNLHWQAASYLVKNYDIILLPTFETKKMVNKESRCITKGTARSMLNLSHYTFKLRLQHQGMMHNKKVILCNEAYTSKTCGTCGVLKPKLGGSKVFECSHCGNKVDRDINGARNIFIRSFSH